MWELVIYFVAIPSMIFCEPQVNRPASQDHHGRGLDIRLAVPGQPGSDYPTLGNIPRTSFSCSGKEPGYYADLETNCQVFRVCTRGSTYGFQSFVCPNGTLFNQAVFVCDWWMNVRCEKAKEMFNYNNEKFGNLRLGAQLMKDVKKMITYPMRNPYDKSSMKSNLVVMQEYIPPNGQMLMTGSLINDANRSPNFLQLKQNLVQNGYSNDIQFAASTPSSLYVPPTYKSFQGDAEVFQRQKQRQNGQYNQRVQSTQNVQTTNFASNGQAGRIVQTQAQQNAFQRNTQYMQTNNFRNAQTLNTQQNSNQGYQTGQYSNGKPAKLVSGKQTEFDMSYSKQQYNVNPTQFKEQYTYQTPVSQFSRDFSGQVNNDAKQNLVSQPQNNVIAKTLTFNKIIEESKPGGPRSRITFKTWLVKPTKAAKLVASPTSYSYNSPTPNAYESPTPYKYERPTKPPNDKLVSQATPYYYNKPTAPPQRISEPEPYVYNKPTSAPQRITEPVGYVYNKPTMPPKQIVTQPPRIYLPPTSPQPTLSGRLYLPPSSVAPTKPARLYIPPTTYKPALKLYLPPPSSSPIILSQQYLPSKPQSEQLRASPTTPTPVYVSPTGENVNPSSFSLTKHSRINANHNNLTFADILTKEKLDITVNDIVKDTSKILTDASPKEFGQIESVDYLDENYLPPEEDGESVEALTSQLPAADSKTARLIAEPSLNLEPPLEQQRDDNQNLNPLSKLPFIQEPTFPTNTIERTVSLKISIPERIATYLFKNQNTSESDRLEILNTGSSNYLVLTNNPTKTTNPASFIPIGKLIENKNATISNSQELVYKFIQDSLNVAKEYGNIAQQNPSKYQNLNNEDIAQITNQISQLTASQYSGNNFNSANIRNVITSTAIVPNTENQLEQLKSTQFSIEPSQQTAQEQLATQVQNSYNQHIQSNQNQVYSGQLYQLPVPDVTNQLYNSGNSAELNLRQDSEAEHLQQEIPPTQSSPEVEIIQSQTLPPAPAKLQQGSTELESFNNQETTQEFIQRILNTGNGIAAQVQDQIVGTIPHPSQDNKLVTYKNDKSYYVITRNNNLFSQNNNQNAKLVQNNIPNVVTFQLIPSVSYQLEDEKDQQRILNAFSIDEFGNPRNTGKNERLTQDINYSVNHPSSTKKLDNLYSGPSSYSAPQASVGSLDLRNIAQSNGNSRLEQFDDDDNVGYGKVTPSIQFTF